MSRTGKTYIVTGGASGLGRATVDLLHRQGANVAIFDRIDPEDGNAIVTKLGAERAAFFSVDVTDRKMIADAVQNTVDKFGGLHGVLNSAGVGSAMKTVGRNGEPMDAGLFDFVLKVNLYGTFYVASICAAAMAKLPPDEKGERGVIVNVASVAAFDGQKGQVPYSASKGGVVAMSLPMARDLARYGIRVNVIAPGVMDTPMMAMASPKVKKNLLGSVVYPKRFGGVAEFAGLVAHIIDNKYLNAEVIRFDAGIRMANL